MREFAGKQNQTPKSRSLNLVRDWQPTPTQTEGHDFSHTAAPSFSHDFSRIPVSAKTPLTIQPKLTIGTPGDRYEQEADRIADTVMRMPDRGTQPIAHDESEPAQSIIGGQQKRVGRKGTEEDEEDVVMKKAAVGAKCDCEEDDKRVARKVEVSRNEGFGRGGSKLSPGVETGIQTMRGGGRPLTSSERQFMEPRFGADFSAIRVHTNQEADAHSRALNARAFTMGGDIFFRAGEYQAGAAEGHRLLAHELTHSIQQGAAVANPLNGLRTSAAVPSAQRDLVVAPPSPDATARILTAAEIASAIDFNSKKYKDPKSLEEIRDVIGITPTPAVSDEELALTVAQWQAEFNLTVDGKLGDLTLGTIVRELKAEGLRPEALRLLLDLHGTAPPGRLTLNFLRVLQDQAPGALWGITVNDDPIFDISVFATPAAWRCVITKADQQSHQGSHLLPGVVEVTNAMVAAEADCARLQTMITSLDSAANQGADSGFYMIAAVQAHEDEHIRQYRAALPAHYTTLRTTIEGLTVPLVNHNTAASAKAAIKALPAFTTAMDTFHAADVAVNNAANAHVPMAPFNAVEHAVVDPMITTIRTRRTALACPP